MRERIDELTRGRREAEREADYWRELALEASSYLEAVQAELEAGAPPDAEGGPDPADYVHGEEDADFVRDLALFQAEMDYRRQAEEAIQAMEGHRLGQLFGERERIAKANLPDYDALVIEGSARGDWVCSPEMAHCIKCSEAGPELAYHLARNPEEARRIAALDHLAQIRELGRIEGRLEGRPQARTATAAPEPAPMLRGGGGRFLVGADTDDFAAFERQFGR